MAYSSDKQYIWPPAFAEDGTATLDEHQYRIVLLYNGISSDASNAADDIVVDKSQLLLGGTTRVPNELAIERIEYAVVGFDAAILEFDNTSDQLIARLSGQGCLDFTESGGMVSDGTGGTGDIVVTTTGGAADAQLSIKLTVKLKRA